jgi:hypothetical protein
MYCCNFISEVLQLHSQQIDRLVQWPEACRHRVTLTLFARDFNRRVRHVHTFVERSFAVKKCFFLVVLSLFFFKTRSVIGVYIMSSAVQHQITMVVEITWLVSVCLQIREQHIHNSIYPSRSRSDDRQCHMHKRDKNFLLYEDQSIMNTKIRFVLLLCVSLLTLWYTRTSPGCYGIQEDLRMLTNSQTTTLVFVTEIIVDKDT